MVVNVIAWKLEVRSERTYKEMPKESYGCTISTEISLSTFKGGLHVTFV